MYVDGVRHWCNSVEKTHEPRGKVPRGELPKPVPETFLAYAISLLRSACDEIETNRQMAKDAVEFFDKLDDAYEFNLKMYNNYTYWEDEETDRLDNLYKEIAYIREHIKKFEKFERNMKNLNVNKMIDKAHS